MNPAVMLDTHLADPDYEKVLLGVEQWFNPAHTNRRRRTAEVRSRKDTFRGGTDDSFPAPAALAAVYLMGAVLLPARDCF